MQLRATLASLALATAGSLAAPLSATSGEPLAFVPQQLHYSTTNPPAAFHAQAARKHIKDNYMVVLKDGVDATTFLNHRQAVASAQDQASAQLADKEAHGIRHIYDSTGVFQGYAGQFTPDVLAYIRAHPEVDYVEQDSIVTTQEMESDNSRVWPQGYDAHFSTLPDDGGLSTQSVEKGAPWGLVRVSHREEVSFKNFGQYLYNSHGGEGVTAYVIDTGININHDEFEGRARWGKTMPSDGDYDGNGHGTHCAGTIGSRKYGVAKKAELVAVKVLGAGGSGSMSDVTGGVLWALEDAKKQTRAMAANPSSTKAKRHRGFVANMSLGGGRSPSLDKAVNGAVTGGLHFAVAAGNENQDACNVSPAGAENPITVGASTMADIRASFSNVGKCVDVFAPGLNILSTWNQGNSSTNTISGTSMATPHVVGMLAYLLSIYGSDEFETINNALPNGHPALAQPSVLSVSGFSSSLAGKIAEFLPVPALALDLVGSLFGGNSNAAVKPTSLVAAVAPGAGSVLHPADMKKALERLSTKNALDDVRGSPNLLIFNNATKQSP